MSLRIEGGGETLWLRPEGAVWWPAQRTVFVADLHLGKGAAFRAQGQAVPVGSSARTLVALEALVQDCGATRLVVLGDFWHGARGVTEALLAEVAAFAARVPTTLVPGNHDRPVVTRDLGLHIEAGPWALNGSHGLHAAHEPPAAPAPGLSPHLPKHFTLAGHCHPAVRLRSRAGDHLRLPCFVVHAHALVLPAFGDLTGARTLDAEALWRQGAELAVLGSGRVHWLPRLAW